MEKDINRVFADRERTNVFNKGEERLIFFFLKRIPKKFTPNTMTAIGLLGSTIVFFSFVVSIFYGRNYLAFGLLGLFINWLGDSLDGRLAYYRQIPRKWYGFSLDIIIDWLGIIFIGLGYFFYAPLAYKVLGFLFVVFYGWSMLISLLKYKITGAYKIDFGIFGPTELRFIIATILVFEIVIPSTINYFAIGVTLLLLFLNIIESRKLLKLGDRRDAEEKIK